MMVLDRYFINYNLTMEEELCAEEPLGLSTVAHGDCKQQQTTVGKNKNNSKCSTETNKTNQMQYKHSAGRTASYSMWFLLDHMCGIRSRAAAAVGTQQTTHVSRVVG